MKIGETLIVYKGGFLIYFCLQANSDGLDGCSKRFRLLCQGRASYGRGGLGATFRGQRQSRKVIIREYIARFTNDYLDRMSEEKTDNILDDVEEEVQEIDPREDPNKKIPTRIAQRKEPSEKSPMRGA